MISETEFGFLNTYLNMAEEDSYLYVNDTIQSMLHETDWYVQSFIQHSLNSKK